jgi:hypothetical protein
MVLANNKNINFIDGLLIRHHIMRAGISNEDPKSIDIKLISFNFR